MGGDGDGGTGATRAAVAVAVGDAVWERVAVEVGVPVGGTGRRREAVAVPVAVAADLRPSDALSDAPSYAIQQEKEFGSPEAVRGEMNVWRGD